MSEHRQLDLRQIGGLRGIIPAWWLSAADGGVSGANAWVYLRDTIEASDKRAGDVRWSPFENGELYGIMPQRVWQEMGSPDLPRVLVAACIVSPGPVKAIFHFDILSNYRLWINGEKIADRWEDDVPSLEKGRVPVGLVEGLNGILLEVPSVTFKDRRVLCSRISAPGGGELYGLKSLAGVKDGGAKSDEGGLALNFSSFDIFRRLTAKEPLMRFKGGGVQDFEAWKAQFKEKFLELLGEFPEEVPLSPRIVERTSKEGVICEKVLIQTEEDVYLPLHLLIPEGNREGKAIVAFHGHGGVGLYGKEQVSGVTEDEGIRKQIDRLNYDYGRRFAREGYITITPDLRTFGERTETLSLYQYDPCDVNYYRYTFYGEHLLKYHVLDGMRTIDYLFTREEVDPERVGLTGLSLGGRMTMYVGALDERMKVCVASGATNLFKERKAIGVICGSQTLPGLLKYGDTPEVFGLIAPRPLLLQLGTNDGTSPELYAPEVDRELRRIYAGADCESRYDLDVFHSGHRYNFETALRWFERWL